MNKKIILGLTTTALLATSVLAYGGHPDNREGCNKAKHSKMMKYGKKHKSGGMFMGIVQKLDLSKEQREKIRTIVKESMKNMPNPNDAFSDTSFDKDEYIKLVSARKNAKISARANVIEKVYAVLNESQKKDLKTMLDAKEIMKKNWHSKK